MSARHLVIGVDGADLALVRKFGPGRLPTLHALMRDGAYAALESVQPPATLPNWTTFLTGVDPGRHGVFDFTLRRGYRVSFTAGTIREAPTIAARLDALGLACACIGFPATYPPERLQNGYFMSGWDSPVAFEADRSFVWPPALYDRIADRFGPPRFDDVDEFAATGEGWHAALAARLVERIERKTELARFLLDEKSFDLFAFYFGETDTASHHLFSLCDAASPRHPSTEPESDALAQVYGAIDRAIARLCEAAGPGVELTIVSDHGSGGSSDKVLYLNRALEEAGLLRFRPERTKAASRLKDIALTRLPARAREKLFGAFGRALPGFLESRARFGAIDMSATRAFSDELNYFPAIHLNLRGREPEGIVDREGARSVAREVEAALLAIVDPWSGRRVVSAVHRREDLFEGPFLERAPDLLLELELDQGYSYNLQPSSSAPAGIGAWRKLAPDEYLGRKGRSLPGSHRSHGLFVAHGPRVTNAGEIRAHIADATATLLARMGVSVPANARGRVLFEIVSSFERGAELPPAPEPRAERRDTNLVEERLRSLGYIDR
jgi:predicted AlkP superfamily phosphohydrolase/phosphomutase